MAVTGNATLEIDMTALELRITDQSLTYPSSLNYSWKTLSFNPYQPAGAITKPGYKGSRLVLELKFTDPLTVSKNVSDTSWLISIGL